MSTSQTNNNMDTAEKAILDLKNTFDLLIDENASCKNYFVVRSSIQSDKEAHIFVKEFGKRTKTSYIQNHYIQNPKKVIFSKTWICQHSSRRKGGTSRRNANCKAGIHVLIKKINYFTIRNDKFLKGEFPLPCRIKIKPIHSHSTDHVESLRMLRVPQEVNEVFFEYFADGLTASQAKHFHENKILEEGGKIEDLASSINNPTDRHVSYLYDIWRQRNCDSHSFAQLTEKVKMYMANGKLPSKRTYFRNYRFWSPEKKISKSNLNSSSSSWKDSFSNEDSNERSIFYPCEHKENEESEETDSVAPDSTTNEIDRENILDNEFVVKELPVPEKVTCSPIVVKLPCNNTAHLYTTQGVQPVQNEQAHDSQICRSNPLTNAEETKLFLRKKQEEDEYDIYGQHIATEMRAIPDDNQRKILKAKLKTLIFKAHHGLLTMSDVISSSDL